MGTIAVRTHDLTKTYRSTSAVDGFSCEMAAGRIYGLIGENGAGKTTLMRMLCGLVTPTSGAVELFEHPDPSARQDDLRRLGCLIEGPSFHPHLTATQNLRLHRIIRGIPSPRVEDELLELVGLGDTRRKRVGDFSLGMRQRLGIAIALVASPELLVLDEPINGLDPVGVVDVRNLLHHLCNERGITILLSSHNLPEVHHTVSDYLIMHKGKLREALTSEELDARCERYLAIKAGDPGELSRALSDLNMTELRVMSDGTVRVSDPPDDLVPVVKQLVDRNIVPTTLAVQGQTLEEYFLSVIGEDRDQSAAR